MGPSEILRTVCRGSTILGYFWFVLCLEVCALSVSFIGGFTVNFMHCCIYVGGV